MVSSCSRAVLWSTCPTVGVGNSASILESVRPPKSAEAHGTGSGSTVRFPLESGPSLSLGVLLCAESSLSLRVPLESLGFGPGLDRACPLCGEWSLSLRVIGFGSSLSLGFVIPKEFPNPTLTGSGEVP